MLAVTRLLERLAARLEHAEVLDRPAELGQSLTSRLPVGPVKDLLSGTHVAHPLHPALVALPIGAFSGAAVLDLLGADRDAARRLLGFGLAAAVPSALTGWSDWGDTDGAERRVGLAHAATNIVGLGLLTGSFVARRRGRSGRVLSLAGLGVLGVGGWLGGHLAYALGVGVDTTAFQRPAAEWTDVCGDTELEAGAPRAVTVVGTPVLLVRDGDAVHALGDRCTHRGAPLHEGPLADGCIECPWHGSRFSLADGSVRRGPATRPAPVFEVRVVAGRVEVRRREHRALRAAAAV